MLTIRVLTLLLFFSLLAPIPCSAQIKINEFLPDLPTGEDETDSEWVELINLFDHQIDIEGYLLSDEKNNQLIITSTHTSDSSTHIKPNQHKIIYRRGAKFSLNNSSDIVNLFDSTSSATPIDTISYSTTTTNKSIGRSPDGSDQIFYSLEPSPGDANSSPPTPTPAPTPKPTSISTTSTSSTNTSTTTSPTPHPSKPPSPHPSSSVNAKLAIQADHSSPSALGISTTNTPEIDKTSSTSSSHENHSNPPPLHSILFLLSAASFLTASATSILLNL